MIESPQVREWMAEGRARGRIEGIADVLLQVLKHRFPYGLPTDLICGIRVATNPDRLRKCVGLAVRAESLETFRLAAGL